MLFDVQDISCQKCSDKIQQAVLARDPTAQVTVQVAERRVRVEGLLTEPQVLETLSAAGYPATTAAPHSGAGSDCCGGCS